MRKEIEKAIENGFLSNLRQIIKIEERTGCNEKSPHKSIVVEFNSLSGHPNGHRYYSLRDLIFGTDFIDKLVGEAPKICRTCVDAECRSNKHRSGTKYVVKCKACGWMDENSTCDLWKQQPQIDRYSWGGYRTPNYHRREMSNIRDIEKLKEYVRGLI